MRAEEKLAIGTVQFGIPYGISNTGGQTPPEEAGSILDVAAYQGIQLVDTASAYGEAEKVLGAYGLDGFRVVSKFMPPGSPHPMTGRRQPESAETLKQQLRRSLNALRVDNLYGYLAHRPSALLEDPRQWELLGMFKNEKLIGKRGFSINTPEELDALLEAGFEPDLVQLPFNYFDRRFESRAKTLKKQGCEVHARSVFLQGLFFADLETLDPWFNGVKAVIGSLQERFRGQHSMMAGALLKFVVEQPFLDKVVVGVETSRQLLDNLMALKMADPLPELGEQIPDSVLTPSEWP